MAVKIVIDLLFLSRDRSERRNSPRNGCNHWTKGLQCLHLCHLMRDADALSLSCNAREERVRSQRKGIERKESDLLSLACEAWNRTASP
jgi:hypothetical protein